jgi:hypothetical protein
MIFSPPLTLDKKTEAAPPQTFEHERFNICGFAEIIVACFQVNLL